MVFVSYVEFNRHPFVNDVITCTVTVRALKDDDNECLAVYSFPPEVFKHPTPSEIDEFNSTSGHDFMTHTHNGYKILSLSPFRILDFMNDELSSLSLDYTVGVAGWRYKDVLSHRISDGLILYYSNFGANE